MLQVIVLISDLKLHLQIMSFKIKEFFKLGEVLFKQLFIIIKFYLLEVELVAVMETVWYFLL